VKNFLFIILFLSHTCSAIDYDAIGKKIWQNEGGGKRENLMVWNQGEAFPSLGIGHFIWYPEGLEEPYTETFPQLLSFIKMEGVVIPTELKQFPWKDRSHFLSVRNSHESKKIEDFLQRTIPIQVEFMAQRLDGALSRLLEVADAERRPQIQHRFEALYNTTSGRYALMDYINFKGEGINPLERYNGEGWGLLQVLEAMQSDSDFVEAAVLVLKRRIQNSPKDQKWEKGWLNRVATYRQD
jgi:hypothetical protein